MLLDLDVADRKIVIFGSQSAARRVVKRYVADGARVSVAVEGPIVPGQDGVRLLPQPEADDLPGLLRMVGPAWLVVLVGNDNAVQRRARELCRHLKVVCTSEPAASDGGRVVLVGGGPGTSRLLTLEAVEVLREADVVCFDRLAPRAELSRLAPAAELIDVGKGPFHHPMSQHEIHRLLVERARAGELVVRLKGGDPFVLGRGGEEMRACMEAGVPVRMVPGVTSAVSVPAAAGIPVTGRGVSRSFTVISGHVPPDAAELSALVQLGGTIVILMGVANLSQIMAGLLRAGLDRSTPAAVVERGFSKAQRTTYATVEALPAEARRAEVSSPAVIVVGEVVRQSSTLGASTGLLDVVHQLSSASDADLSARAS